MSQDRAIFVPALDIQARASDFLVARRERRPWTEEEEHNFQTWLSESMAHRVAYWRLESVWERADRLNALRPLSQPAPQSADKSPWRGKILFAVAAAAVAGVVALAPFTGSLIWHAGQVTYATPIGGRETILLADGTRIDLNTNTVIRAAFSANARKVELVRGEALFRVKHDETRPFVLLAVGHRVIDLGTKFLAREEGVRLKVSLLEGSARVEANAPAHRPQSAVLTPGDEAIVTDHGLSVTRKSHRQLDSELGWQRGLLVFDRTTLVEVAKEYNRYNKRKIVIGDAMAGARMITVTLPTNDVLGFARMARNFLGLHVDERRTEIVISH